MATKALVQVSAGSLSLSLNPSIGGSICGFDWTDKHRSARILRGCNRNGQNVLEASSFPLVPFVNRIKGGRFTFRGRTVRLQPNMAGDPSPLHGQGWLSAWTVEHASEAAAALSFRHDAGEWPWEYEARQEFALDDGGLSVMLSCRNLSAEAMPCGLGQHPYF